MPTPTDALILPGPWLDHLEREIPVARAGLDSEGVHQVRVAAGRLSVWLRLCDRRILRDDLRWLRGSAGALRDLDVLLDEDREHTLDPRFADWLRGERAQRHAQLCIDLSSARLRALLEACAWLQGLDEDFAYERLAVFERHLARAGKRVGTHGDDPHAWHRLRRTARRLRYAREWLELDTDELKRLQEALGALNDAVVLLRCFDAWPGSAQLAHERARMLHAIDALRASALATWEDTRAAVGVR